MSGSLDIVVLGLSITSSWGNGHATTYRGLVRELVKLGHRVLFLERNVPWYESNRDLANPPYGRTELYGSLDELNERFADHVRRADLVVVGSYVPQGAEVGRWVQGTARGLTAFYDIDTPVTIARLARGECEYLTRDLVPRYDLYLSFTGGPLLSRIERAFGAQAARPLYCSFDPTLHGPKVEELRWDLGYLGTYSDDRQPVLEELMLAPARKLPRARFVVAGPQYPDRIAWPKNVERIDHIAPGDHNRFYSAQRFTLNVTRADMREAGYSPSVRLFEAAACGVPVISDAWAGLETFFTPGEEILIAHSAEETLKYLKTIDEDERLAIGQRARERALREHTAAHRAHAVEQYVREVLASRRPRLREATPSTLGA